MEEPFKQLALHRVAQTGDPFCVISMREPREARSGAWICKRAALIKDSHGSHIHGCIPGGDML